MSERDALEATESALTEEFRVYADAAARAYADVFVARLDGELKAAVSSLRQADDAISVGSELVTRRLHDIATSTEAGASRTVASVATATKAFDDGLASLRARCDGVADAFRDRLIVHAESLVASAAQRMSGAEATFLKASETSARALLDGLTAIRAAQDQASAALAVAAQTQSTALAEQQITIERRIEERAAERWSAALTTISASSRKTQTALGVLLFLQFLIIVFMAGVWWSARA